MDFDEAIKILNARLAEKQPALFSSSWIFYHAPEVYRYVWKNIKTPLGDIDWDRVTYKLDREFQKHWTQRKPRKVKPYRNIQEVRKMLKPFEDKLYIFIAPADKDDRLLRDAISIGLVRLAQRGNIRAWQKLLELLRYMVDQWIEQSWKLKVWHGYTDDIDDKLKACIRCYRFTGTFIGYLFKTLEYSGRGLYSLHSFSLNSPVAHHSHKTFIENLVKDYDTGEIQIYDRVCISEIWQ